MAGTKVGVLLFNYKIGSMFLVYSKVVWFQSYEDSIANVVLPIRDTSQNYFLCGMPPPIVSVAAAG